MNEKDDEILLNENEYEIVFKDITDLAQIDRDDDIYVICTICGDAMPTAPKRSVRCKCGNVDLDLDYCRIGARDLSKCKVVRLLGKKKK
jgi:hypothetical protein